MVLLSLSFGCGSGSGSGSNRGDDSSAGKPTSIDQAAESIPAQGLSKANPANLLKTVLERYAHATSYSDHGIVVLRQGVEGDDGGNQTVTRTAPLSIWFDRGQVRVSAYDLRIAIDSGQQRAWIIDPATANFDAQVLQHQQVGFSTGKRPSLDVLLSDPILAGRIQAGLAGPPPQLEWLFSADPMKRLFESDVSFKSLPQTRIDERWHQTIEATNRNDRYVFYVDANRSIVRRIDLPSIPVSSIAAATAASFAGNSPRKTPQIQLSIDLRDASFDAPLTPVKLNGFPRQPILVKRFVTLPPPRPSTRLGKQIETFRLPLNNSSQRFESSRPRSKATVLLQLPANPSAQLALLTLDGWYRRLQSTTRDQIQCIAIASLPLQKEMQDALTVDVAVDRQGLASRAFGIDGGPDGGRALAVLDASGRIAWWQSSIDANTMPMLSQIMADVLQGVDVPQRVRQQWNEQVGRYHEALAAAKITND